ncbi:MAG TPA: hypothetical protein VK420_01500 [Longimicrobium sp.]|nr:hypothetical protein [Longimicrobium sp.]
MARRKQPDETSRIRNLIALDAANIMRRLEARREEMITLFSRLRSREPMLQTIATCFATITFHDLARLPVREQAAVNQFHECLGELRWYFTYTEDMPSTVQLTISGLHRRLVEAHRKLVDAVGHPATLDGGTVVESKVVRREHAGGEAPTAPLVPMAPVRRRRAPARGAPGE